MQLLIKKILSPGCDPADAYAVRTAVFVDEQGFSAGLEIDALDPQAYHIVFYEDGDPVATGRFFQNADKPEEFIIGRVAVVKTMRGAGLGRVLMAALEDAAKQQGAKRAVLGAQCQAREFYEKHGYTATGDVYYDEHCPHVHMEKVL